MRNQIRYFILKLIFALIFVVISFYLCHGLGINFITNVDAAVLSHQSTSFNNVITNTDANYTYSISNRPFAHRPEGNVSFSVVLNKVSGIPTAPIVMLRSVVLSDNNSLFACTLGSTSITNSTFGGSVYTITCPVDLSNSNGLASIRFEFADNQQNDTSSYRFTFNGLLTYQGTGTNVNVDTSGTTSAINSQTSSIINNNNQNTQSINNNINNINNNINDTDVDDEIDDTSDWIDNFSVSSHGLSGVVTAPFRLIQSFTGSTCTALTFQLPFVHNQVTLPCLQPLIREHFPTLLALFQLITTGLIAYRVCINYFELF